jgi:hypothetical protein
VTPQAAPSPWFAASQPSSDEEHIARLRDFYSDYRPDDVDRAEALFKKHGEKIWADLEKKYAGKTAEYTEVLLDNDGMRAVKCRGDLLLCVVTACRTWFFVRRPVRLHLVLQRLRRLRCH